MSAWLSGSLGLIAALLLVAINGFFVAAEFALVKVRPTRLKELADEGRAMAASGLWLARRLDASLSACQLGITVASLGLGWVGEPAVARLIEPLMRMAGLTSPALVHGSAFVIAFSLITSLHLVIGEQAPKIFAIRRPEPLLLLFAGPLRVFYVVSYPFLHALNWASSALLRQFGVEAPTGHEVGYSEPELRLLLEQARGKGELSRTEHQLLNAVFEFDDQICRRVMVPRADVVYLDLSQTYQENLELARRTKHTRYPICEGTLDEVVGVVHLKDLFQLDPSSDAAGDFRELMRPPQYVPETMPVSRLLRFFQTIKQHLALVVDEYGAVVGIVTLENVLEQIVGRVEDEFDAEPPYIVPAGSDQFLVMGTTPVSILQQRLGLELSSDEADTLSGLLLARAGRILRAGDRIELDSAVAEVVETRGTRAESVRISIPRERAEVASS